MKYLKECDEGDGWRLTNRGLVIVVMVEVILGVIAIGTAITLSP